MKLESFLKLAVSFAVLWLSGCENMSQSSTSQSPASQSSMPQSSTSQPSTSTATNQQPGSASSGSQTSPSSGSAEPPSASSSSTTDQGYDEGYQGYDEGDFSATSDEQIEELDQELNESLAEFDGMILEQQASAATLGVPFDQEQSQESHDGDEYSDGEELFEEGDLYEGLPGYGGSPNGTDSSEEQGPNFEGDNIPVDVAGENSGSRTASASGSGASNGSGAVPADIPSGSDDDIVARQIREAAMQEKDPALREKLWNEYRKYKSQ